VGQAARFRHAGGRERPWAEGARNRFHGVRRRTRGRESSGGDRVVPGPKQPRTATDSGTEQSPEGGLGFLAPTFIRGQGRRANDRRAEAGDEPARPCRRETPWRANLGRGCGVKQTRKAGRGASRRGREKRRGRNGAGLGCPRSWTPLADVAKEAWDPMEGARSRKAEGGVGSRDSGEERNRTRG
jgi:hypothetical protein